MCKAIDEPTTTAVTCTSTEKSSGPQQQAFLKEEEHAIPAAAGSNRRVHFGAHSFHEIERISDPQEKDAVWYTHHDYQAMRSEIGAVLNHMEHMVQMDYFVSAYYEDAEERVSDNPLDCFRGLEFIKLSDDEPSRKERRMDFVKSVLLFQFMLQSNGKVLSRKSSSSSSTSSTSTCSSTSSEDSHDDCHSTPASRLTAGMDDALGAYCVKRSQESYERALKLASYDTSQARCVYHECRLIYRLNGNEVSMFPSTLRRSSICREQVPVTSGAAKSLSSWLRVLNTALFAETQ